MAKDNLHDPTLSVVEDIETKVDSIIEETVIIEGTSPGGNALTTIILDSNASANDREYDLTIIKILSGTGAGQSRQIWQYVGSTKTAYINREWETIPDNTSVYSVIFFAGNSHVDEGKAQAGSINTLTLRANSSSQTGLYDGQALSIVGGTGAGQTRVIISYNGTTKVATLDIDWIVTPDSSSIYAMYPFPGFIHALPTVDSATNFLIRDAVGNKNDTVGGTSLIALIKKTFAEIEIVEHHFHTREKWFGLAASPSGETHRADRMAGGILPFQLTAGNLILGNWVQVLGTADTPVEAGKISFDAHRFMITDTNSVNPYLVQIVAGESADIAAKILAEEFTEVPYISASPNNDSGISVMRTLQIPAGQKIWARCVCIGSNGSTIDFYYGIHEYD